MKLEIDPEEVKGFLDKEEGRPYMSLQNYTHKKGCASK